MTDDFKETQQGRRTQRLTICTGTDQTKSHYGGEQVGTKPHPLTEELTIGIRLLLSEEKSVFFNGVTPGTVNPLQGTCHTQE